MLTIYLKPVVPAFAEKVERILNEPESFDWENRKYLLSEHVIGKIERFIEGRFERTIGQFERLMDRVDMKAVEKVMESAKQKGVTAVKIPAPTHSHLTKHGEDTAPPAVAPGGLIEYDDFAKIQLRTAKVLTAERMAKADKLLKLSIDVGGEVRTLVAGIAKSYTPEEMVGKTIVIVANLKPRKLMGVESNGMLLAVNDGEKLTLIGPAGEVGSGLKVS
jgi:methionine--tRNA ligase beta chain